MRIVVAGTRDAPRPRAQVEAALEKCGFPISEIVTGEDPEERRRRGLSPIALIDAAAHDWAVENGIECVIFGAEWSKYGNAAGPIRNSRMAEYGDALVLVWDGRSRGSRDMRQKALKRHLLLYELRF